MTTLPMPATGEDVLAAAKEAYAVAAALGSPIDAPSGAAVYRATVFSLSRPEMDHLTYSMDYLTYSFEDAETAVREYLVQARFPLLSSATGWLPVKCPDCLAWETEPVSNGRFWNAYRQVSRNQRPAEKAESPHAPLLCQVKCVSGCEEANGTSDQGPTFDIDLTAPEYDYLYRLPAVESMFQQIGFTVTVEKIILGQPETEKVS